MCALGCDNESIGTWSYVCVVAHASHIFNRLAVDGTSVSAALMQLHCTNSQHRGSRLLYVVWSLRTVMSTAVEVLRFSLLASRPRARIRSRWSCRIDSAELFRSLKVLDRGRNTRNRSEIVWNRFGAGLWAPPRAFLAWLRPAWGGDLGPKSTIFGRIFKVFRALLAQPS